MSTITRSLIMPLTALMVASLGAACDAGEPRVAVPPAGLNPGRAEGAPGRVAGQPGVAPEREAGLRRLAEKRRARRAERARAWARRQQQDPLWPSPAGHAASRRGDPTWHPEIARRGVEAALQNLHQIHSMNSQMIVDQQQRAAMHHTPPR